MQIELEVQGVTHGNRSQLLMELGHNVDRAGGWVLERRPTTKDAVNVFLEVQSCALEEVYAALMDSGLELTSASHHVLAQRCGCSLLLRPDPMVSSIVSICVSIRFLAEPVPPVHRWQHMLLGAAAA